jgi:biotin carboxylase
MARRRPLLANVSEIRAYLRTNRTPINFISPTAFNLMGVDRWVSSFNYVTYFDSYEGGHPRVFVPRERETREFQSIEEICNYLLAHPEVSEFVKRQGPGGKACFVMFDEESEQLAAALGLEVAHPSAELRSELDSKIVTTRIGNRARVPSVPNVLGRADDYGRLRKLARDADLGDDLVVQTAYGDSGRTTYFVKNEADWRRHGKSIAGQDVKVMRRIRPVEVCVEAVITRHGTLVGPYVASLVGHPELTPYKGGWCGNDIYPTVLSKKQRRRASKMTQRLGAELARHGYRGFFEVDYLLDVDTGELYLGELNPRVSGLSPITHVTLAAYSDMPLFLFHLLEYMDVDYEIDVDEINERWARLAADDVWSQLIIKETAEQVELLTRAPRSGIWRLDDRGRIRFRRWAHDWHSIIDESEAFYLRVAAAGDYRYRGADLGVLVTRGRMQDDDHRLTPRCQAWIDGIKRQYAGTPVGAAEKPPVDPFAFKLA